MHTLLIVPASNHAGLTSLSIGMVRALDREGVRVGFFKPIGQSYQEKSDDLSNAYVRQISALDPPEPISLEEAESLVADGKSELLLEKISANYEKAAARADLVIVEGLQASEKYQFLNQLNPRIARALNAEIIFVASSRGVEVEDSERWLRRRFNAAYDGLGEDLQQRVLGVIINGSEEEEGKSKGDFIRVSGGKLRKLGYIPYEPSLRQLRAYDLVEPLHVRILNEGEMMSRRITQIYLCARNIDHITHIFHAGALIVTPADRSDIILSTCFAALKGVPIGALILTGNTDPSQEVLEYCKMGIESGIPFFETNTSSFETATILNAVNPEIPVDDVERLENLVEHVARHIDVEWILKHSQTPDRKRLSPPAFRYKISQLASANPQRIVLPEGNEPRTIEAAIICHQRSLAKPVLLGDSDEIQTVATSLGLEIPSGVEIVNPDSLRGKYLAPFMELRKHKNLSESQAVSYLENDVTLGTMMLAEGDVAGLVAGAVHSTADTIRPALQLIRTAPGMSGVSSVFFMCLPSQVLVYGDCAINLDPDAKQLADIAVQSAHTAAAFGIDPRVAMISYSTHGSGSGADVEKVREATALVRAMNPDFPVDGPLQYDAASNAKVAAKKAPDSVLKGDATVFIFPDLNTGNTTYKAVQRAGNVISMGPVLQGLNKPVNDLSRGASVEDIVFTIAITCIQAQQ